MVRNRFEGNRWSSVEGRAVRANRIRVRKSVAVGNSCTIKSAERDLVVKEEEEEDYYCFCKSIVIIIFKINFGGEQF